MQSKIMNNLFTNIFTVSVIFYFMPLAHADTDHLAIESMIGKYEGVIQVMNINTNQHPYQTEILSVDKSDNSVSLSAYCPDCGKKELTRTNCRITEANEKIKFTCKGPTSDELYIFNGIRLKATGFGNNYPYTINVTKIAK